MHPATQIFYDIIFLGLFLLVFLINYKVFQKKLFHPSVLFSAIWLAVILLHSVCKLTVLPLLYPLSFQSYLIFFLGTVSFTTGSFFSTVMEARKSGLNKTRSIGLPVNQILRVILTGICLIGLPFFIQSSVKAFIASQVEDFFVGLRNELSYGDTDIGPTKYLVTFSFLIYGLNLMANIKNKTRLNILLLWLSFAIALTYATFSTGRTFFLMIICIYIGIAYVQNKNFRLKRFFLLIPLFLIFFTLFGLIFGKGGNFENSFNENLQTSSENTSIYIVTPLSSFDYELVNNKAEANYRGDNTLRFFYLIGESLGITHLKKYDKSLIKEFVFVPYENNVFTIYSPYVKDFGAVYAYCFLMLIAGVHTRCHNKAIQSKNARPTIYFALLLYPLLMSFFQDQYMLLFSTWLQMIFFIEAIFFVNRIFFAKIKTGASQ